MIRRKQAALHESPAGKAEGRPAVSMVLSWDPTTPSFNPCIKYLATLMLT